MKKLLFLLCCLPSFIFAQNLHEISEAEAKANAPLINYTLNTATQNYDLKYHRLEFVVDPTQPYISGDVTSYFTAKEDLSEIVFDLAANMDVSQVTQNGNPLTFSRDGDELVIQLSQTQLQGVLDSLTVSYSGNPVSSGFGSFEQTTHNGNEIIWTLSEPYGAKAWWPCKQDLNDKVDSLDTYITFPKKNSNNIDNVAVSNGLEMSQTVTGEMKTTHFHHSHPIPAYLIAIAVSNYSVYTEQVDNNGNPFQVVNYVYPEDEDYVQQQTAMTPDIIEFYSSKFGEYPYADEKYGHCQFGWGGGMEHTTVSFMGGFSQELIAHELGHQWFGDDVTCGSWQDVWLNEGFANYMYAMVRQHFDGEESFKTWRQYMVSSITNYPGGSVYVPAEDTTSVNRIFSKRLTYNKGAMVLNMLRQKLGDDDFFQSLRNYLNNPDLAYGYAYTEDLEAELEAQTGLDLAEFFADWIYGEGFPTYHLKWDQADDGHVNITLSQEQSMPSSVDFFEGDVPIRLIGSNSQTFNTTLDQTQDDQYFSVDPGFAVEDVQVDPDAQIISRNNTSALGLASADLKPVRIYPNPAKTTVSISKPDSLKIETVEIYDTLGKLVEEMPYQSIIDVSTLSSGLYFIQLNSQKDKTVKSLIVN